MILFQLNYLIGINKMKEVKSRISYDFHVKQMSSINPRMTTTFNCPSCGIKLYSMKPEKGGHVYTSTMICPNCDSVLSKVVYCNGKVESERVYD